MNKKTIALSEEQYVQIINAIRNGFVCADGHVVKPNNRIATVLTLEANLGMRISDILHLRLSDIILSAVSTGRIFPPVPKVPKQNTKPQKSVPSTLQLFLPSLPDVPLNTVSHFPFPVQFCFHYKKTMRHI